MGRRPDLSIENSRLIRRPCCDAGEGVDDAGRQSVNEMADRVGEGDRVTSSKKLFLRMLIGNCDHKSDADYEPVEEAKAETDYDRTPRLRWEPGRERQGYRCHTRPTSGLRRLLYRA